MIADGAKLGRFNAGFALAGCITVLFSTALAWTKDAYQPLNSFMNSLAWHNWITHGLADVILFFGLGLLFSRSNWVASLAPNRLISLLVAAVMVSGFGLFVWYVLF